MNKIQLVGRITKDVELQTTMNGVDYVRFNVACKSKMKNADGETQTDFFICVAWREKAELLAKYCKKGDLINIMGAMGSRKYDNAGEQATVWEVNIEDVEFLTTRADREQSQAEEKLKTKTKSKSKEPELTPLDDIDDDDLPF